LARDFFTEGFKFGESFQILRAASGALGTNELVEAEALADSGKDIEVNRRADEIVPASATWDFAEQVDLAERRFESEIQPLK
jgi:hypothetical protein